MLSENGKLFVVATPIGNLADFSYRAVETLQKVDLIAAEDTRRARVLLQHYGINQELIALHEHNEEKMTPIILEQLCKGKQIALISDAGTPLISDPGVPLVSKAKQSGIEVCPIPGPCALITALSASGMPTHQFDFAGFLPRTSLARVKQFEKWLKNENTLIFYESSHRIEATVQDLIRVFPSHRHIAVARELTKLHETIVLTTLAELEVVMANDAHSCKGEFVIILEGAKDDSDIDMDDKKCEHILQVLLQECSIKSAVSIAFQLTGIRKKLIYKKALLLKDQAAQ
ncbi:MAG: 16S rRNA (cytidine(1402)-2'-O)-methyltransferase [Methylococcaceae bacterium]